MGWVFLKVVMYAFSSKTKAGHLLYNLPFCHLISQFSSFPLKLAKYLIKADQSKHESLNHIKRDQSLFWKPVIIMSTVSDFYSFTKSSPFLPLFTVVDYSPNKHEFSASVGVLVYWCVGVCVCKQSVCMCVCVFISILICLKALEFSAWYFPTYLRWLFHFIFQKDHRT